MVLCYRHRNSCGTCTGMRQLTLEDGKTFGVAQQVQGARAKEIEALLNETEKYMREEVHKDPKYNEVKDGCQNRNELCTFWALIGECEKNPKFMQMVRWKLDCFYLATILISDAWFFDIAGMCSV